MEAITCLGAKTKQDYGTHHRNAQQSSFDIKNKKKGKSQPDLTPPTDASQNKKSDRGTKHEHAVPDTAATEEEMEREQDR